MIELAEVSRTVQSGAGPLTILHPTSLTIARGQVVAISGPSGSGKSTLLGLIAGLDAPTTGRIVVDGITITEQSEERLARLRGEKIGIVFQFFHLLPSLTALENILVPMEIAGTTGSSGTTGSAGATGATGTTGNRMRERARALLDDVGLADRAHHYPSQLSGGEQQRVAIARALANDPPVLLADEPTGNLDSATGRQVIELLVNVGRGHGRTLVLVTHDPDLASLTDEVISLRDGRVVDRRPPGQASS